MPWEEIHRMQLDLQVSKGSSTPLRIPKYHAAHAATTRTSTKVTHFMTCSPLGTLWALTAT